MINLVHFISGLPRSGSTLLSAVLRQNPRFCAGVSSPLAPLCGTLHQRMGSGEFSLFFDEGRRLAMLRGLFEAYYSRAAAAGHLVFDTNRTWTARIPLLMTLYPRARVICCVREVGWILDSVERLRAKNPLQVSKMFNPQTGATVYTRAEALMNSEKGLVGGPWTTLREAWFADEANRLVVVPYESLVRQPERTLRRLYQELDEAPFDHDFDNVSYEEPDYDAQLGMPGLHTVRSKICYEERRPRVPPDLFSKYANTSFWTRPELNTRDITVL
jgi:sulfotransferase